MSRIKREAALISPYGAVRIYVRHAGTCKIKNDSTDCGCSWWLYSHRRGGAKLRRSLSTRDRVEAMKLADQELQDLRPESKRGDALSPLEAISLFINRRDLDCDGTRQLFRSLLGRVDADGTRQGKLLTALDEAGIQDVRDVVVDHLKT